MFTNNRRMVGCWGADDVVTVIAFSCLPVRPEKMNLASISPDSPGAYSVFVKAAVVQPQEVLTFSIFKDCLPVLVNRYFATTDSSCGLELKVCSGFCQANWPKAGPANAHRKKTNVLIGVFRFNRGKCLTRKQESHIMQIQQLICKHRNTTSCVNLESPVLL